MILSLSAHEAELEIHAAVIRRPRASDKTAQRQNETRLNLDHGDGGRTTVMSTAIGGRRQPLRGPEGSIKYVLLRPAGECMVGRANTNAGGHHIVNHSA